MTRVSGFSHPGDNFRGAASRLRARFTGLLTRPPDADACFLDLAWGTDRIDSPG